MHWILPRKK